MHTPLMVPFQLIPRSFNDLATSTLTFALKYLFRILLPPGALFHKHMYFCSCVVVWVFWGAYWVDIKLSPGASVFHKHSLFKLTLALSVKRIAFLLTVLSDNVQFGPLVIDKTFFEMITKKVFVARLSQNCVLGCSHGISTFIFPNRRTLHLFGPHFTSIYMSLSAEWDRSSRPLIAELSWHLEVEMHCKTCDHFHLLAPILH